MNIDKHIFRAYDIRGEVATQLTPEATFIIAQATMLALFKPGDAIIVGRDCRLHSPMLAEALIRGLKAQGAHILDLQVVTTPMLYFAASHREVAGAIMVTGSHNPVSQNGLKICRGSNSIGTEDVKAIRAITEKEIPPCPVEGTYETLDITDEYIDTCLSLVDILPPKNHRIKLVVDAGNATGGPFICKMLEKLPVDFIPIFCDMDGHFPNHHPDPTIDENLKQLKAKVLEHHADFGISFDGDADRLGVVDEKAQVIPADQLIILFARYILSYKPGAKVIGDVKCSKNTYDAIRQAGGVPIMWKAGHSLIKAKLRETQAACGAELSGHFFFNDRWFGYDDGLYSALRLLEIFSRMDKPLSRALEDLPKLYSTIEMRIECPDDVKFPLSQQVLEHYRQHYEVCDIDGVRIDFPHAWALIRASNTQPVLVVRVEAFSPEELEETKRDVFGVCQKVAESLGTHLHF